MPSWYRERASRFDERACCKECGERFGCKADWVVRGTHLYHDGCAAAGSLRTRVEEHERKMQARTAAGSVAERARLRRQVDAAKGR